MKTITKTNDLVVQQLLDSKPKAQKSGVGVLAALGAIGALAVVDVLNSPAEPTETPEPEEEPDPREELDAFIYRNPDTLDAYLDSVEDHLDRDLPEELADLIYKQRGLQDHEPILHVENGKEYVFPNKEQFTMWIEGDYELALRSIGMDGLTLENIGLLLRVPGLFELSDNLTPEAVIAAHKHMMETGQIVHRYHNEIRLQNIIVAWNITKSFNSTKVELCITDPVEEIEEETSLTNPTEQDIRNAFYRVMLTNVPEPVLDMVLASLSKKETKPSPKGEVTTPTQPDLSDGDTTINNLIPDIYVDNTYQDYLKNYRPTYSRDGTWFTFSK